MKRPSGNAQLILAPTLFAVGLGLLASQPALPSEPVARPAAPADAAGVRFFEMKIRPLLAARCYACHGPQKQTSGLRLDSRDSLLKGGESGAAVVPGHPEKSLLVEIVHPTTGRMPPTGKLKPTEVSALTEWVKLGAPWGVESVKGGTVSKNPAADFRNPKSPAAKS
ncbi:MAG: c-type cytochrome domain-containing protein, partial [Actinomycetota bacterium]